MPTTFAVATGTMLAATLQDLSYGTDAAPNTIYTIALSTGVTLASAALSLEAGSSLTLVGPGQASIANFEADSPLSVAGTLAGVVLLNGALSVAAGGAVLGSVQGDETANVAIDNAGSITDLAAGSVGVLAFAGAITNEAGAQIGGDQFGLFVSSAGTLGNDGTIAAAASSGYGAYLASGTLSNGTAGVISGASGAAGVAGLAVVSNLGTLLGGDQFGLVIGDGTVTNGAADNPAALIDGTTVAGVVSVGVEVQGTATATAITNDGTIGGHVVIGIALTNGTVTNDLGGVLLGSQEAVALAGQGEVVDAGTIIAGSGTQGTLATGIALGGGTVVITPSGSISATNFAVSALNGAGVSNAGQLTAGDAGVALFGGGVVQNLAGGTIEGAADGVRIVDGVAEIANAGTISGAVGVFLASDGAGTVTNAGLIGSTAGANGVAVQFSAGDERLVLAAGGAFHGRVVGDDGAGSSTVLELDGIAATLSGLAGDAGTLADAAGRFGFSGIDGLDIDAGATATATGSLAAVTIAGTLNASGALSLGTVEVVSHGVAAVGEGARLVVGEDEAAASRIALAGGGTLVVAQPAVFGSGSGVSYVGPAIEAAPGGVIELGGLPAAGAVIEGFASGVLQVASGVERASVRIGNPFAGEFFHLGAAPDGATDVTVEGTPCYCHGTLILTETGEVAVEALRIGERVITLSGASRAIRWIGRRCYSGRFAAGNRDVLPVLIRAGALADGVPRRDLAVSPLHAMLLDGVLIPAAALVNGVSIVQASAVERVDYVHVELETHDVILAEGAASETFVDDGGRGMFHNAAEYRRLYPEAEAKAKAKAGAKAGARAAAYCAPRVESGPVLEAVRRGIAARWRPATAADPLRGRLDHVGRDRVCGWARDGAAPTRLQVLVNGAVLCEVVADRHRPDLEAAGIGDGRHAFELVIPGGLSPMQRHRVQVRRADGAELPGSPWVIEAAPLTLSPPAAPTIGFGLGRLDVATRERISGWALGDAAGAAALQVLDNGAPIARVLANAPRPDLAASGVGEMGRCAFDLAIPGGLSPLARHVIEVRREADGAALPGSPMVIEAADSFDGLQQAVAQAVAGLDAAADRRAALRFIEAQAEQLRRSLARPARPRGGQRALLIDERLPDPNRDAASVALLSHARALRRLGYEVGIAAAVAPSAAEQAVLEANGVTWCGGDEPASVEQVLRQAAGGIALIYLYRAASAARYLALARQHMPQARIVYSVADLHHLRLERQAAAEGRPELLAAARRAKLAECVAAWSADAVITHSAHEAALLRAAVPEATIHVVPWAVRAQPPAAFAPREGIAFVGGYGHAPNADAARWLVETIMPLVWRTLPELPCLLVGSDMPGAVRALAGRRVVALGQVADLPALLGRTRLTVAPLRYGAGVKGKVLDSLAAGTPCVMTSVAAEGLELPPSLQGLVADTPEAIAALICRIYQDPMEHAAASRSGLAMVRRKHGQTTVMRGLRKAITGQEGQGAVLPGTLSRSCDENPRLEASS